MARPRPARHGAGLTGYELYYFNVEALWGIAEWVHWIAGRSGAPRSMRVDEATQMQHTGPMKTAILPQVRVEPELRADLESVLRNGETLSEFVEATVRSAVEYRRTQSEFHARGEAAWQAFQRDGESYPASQVTNELRKMLDEKRKQIKTSPRSK